MRLPLRSYHPPRRSPVVSLAFLFVLQLTVGTAFADLYVNRTALGNGRGSSAANAASYLDATFWAGEAQTAINAGPTTVWFARATYDLGRLKLDSVGHPVHLLTLRVTAGQTSFLMKNDGQTQIMSIYGCQNIKLQDFIFSGSVTQNAVVVKSSADFAPRPSRWITFENCNWHSMSAVLYAALSLQEGARDITVNNCKFWSNGISELSHMIYAFRKVQNVSITNSQFTNCRGAYIKLRHDVDYVKIDNCDFHSTADEYNWEFIKVAADDSASNPGGEFFGGYFQITNNSFDWDTSGNIDNRWGLAFKAYGHNVASPLDYWVTPSEASTLNTGTAAQKQAILSPQMGLSNANVKFYGNTWAGAHGQVYYRHQPSSDSGDGGHTAPCNITNWPGTSGVLAAPPFLRNPGFEWGGDARRDWFTYSGLEPATHAPLNNSTVALRLRRDSTTTVFGQPISGAASNCEVKFLMALGAGSTPSSSVRFKVKIYHNEIADACLVLAITGDGQVGYLQADGTFVSVSGSDTLLASAESAPGSGYYPNPNWYQFRIRTSYSGGVVTWEIARGGLKTIPTGTFPFVYSGLNQWRGGVPAVGAKPGSITFENVDQDVIIDSTAVANW